MDVPNSLGREGVSKLWDNVPKFTIFYLEGIPKPLFTVFTLLYMERGAEYLFAIEGEGT